MKKIIILKHGGGELANQLWNYISIYAFGLETKIPVKNPSFFEYHSFFNFLPNESLFTRWRALFFRTVRRRSHILNRWARLKYSFHSGIISTIHPRSVFSSENNTNTPTHIPPTKPFPQHLEKYKTLYFVGWLFRNPVGLQKWRSKLIQAFAPNEKIEARVNGIVAPLRQKYEKIIGVHIRQTDYKIFKGGKFLISQERVREIVGEYAREKALDANKTLFLVVSDGKIDETLFKNLNIYASKENAVTDLFLLSKTDTILGSNSTFSNFAAWFGDIPRIILTNEPIDWEYYTDKKSFFENKYAFVTQH